jgi:hypothetical protein
LETLEDRTVPSSATHLSISLSLPTIPSSAPSPVVEVQSFTPFTLTVTALDQNGNVDPTYTGTVRFETSDPGNRVSLPPAITFAASDAGVHTFTNVVLQTPGILATVTATDTTTPTITGQSGLIYTALPPDPVATYVNLLTTTFLGRPATPDDTEPALSFIQPEESYARHLTALQLVPSNEARTRLITTDYERFLGRAPTSSELSTALASLQFLGTPEELIASILNTDEYFTKVGGTNQAWVNAVYQALLNRAPNSNDPDFVTTLNNGTETRNQAVITILNGPEYRGDYITSIYQAYLSRTPSSSEIQSWLQPMGSQGPGDPSADEQFEALVLGSTEFYWRNGNRDSQWLTGVYLTLLNRQPDAAGYTAGLLQTESIYGYGRYNDADDRVSRLEYRQKLVTGFYMTFLGRSPTAAELNDGVNMTYDFTDAGVEASLLITPEYFNKAGGTNSAWLDAIYQALLGRAPSSSESSAALMALTNDTTTLNQVAVDILRTDEYRTDLIESYYSTYLGRAADATGLANALADSDAGTANEQILAMLLASPEYYAKNGLQ